MTLVPNPSPTPPPKPVAAVAPGFYVVVSEVEYGTSGPLEFPAVRTTAYVSPTRFYALIEGDQPRVSQTFTWSISNGMLERTLLCSSFPSNENKTFVQRIDASDDGFTIYAVGTATVDGYVAIRYVRAE